ncbi:MAG: hypothetical protein M0Q91_18205 [Methanoregula sp.]|nr:hypothetical protein [Methanoregula sp.]
MKTLSNIHDPTWTQLRNCKKEKIDLGNYNQDLCMLGCNAFRACCQISIDLRDVKTS